MTDQTSALVRTEESKITLGQTALRPEDIVLPRIKVVQQMSKESVDSIAPPGSFFNTLTGEDYGDKIRVQPILPVMQRVFLTRQEKRGRADDLLTAAGLPVLSEGDGLKCRSFDMVQGRGEPGVECAQCPLSEWTKDAKGKNVPPMCTETYNVAASTELGDLIILSFSKSSAKNGKRLFSALRLAGAAAPWTRFFDIYTRAERNDLGSFYVPDFKVVTDVRPDSALIGQALFWAEQLAGVPASRLDVTPEDELPGEGEDDVNVDEGGDSPF